MEYSHAQLKFIQKQLIRITADLKNKDGVGMLLTASELITWVSHAQLAGYSTDKDTGRMYRKQGNIRTYFE